MSEINKALSQLATKQNATLKHIQAARVEPVSQRSGWIWALGGFALSLAVGGWAVSSQAPVEPQTSMAVTLPEQVAAPSPTQKTEVSRVDIYQPEKEPAISAPPAEPAKEKPKAVPAPALVARTAAAPTPQPAADEPAQMSVEQVELTPQQLAEKAMARAGKALDSNDLQSAVSAYVEALRYMPENERARQKLAALYYGKGDVRRAFDLLQAGIELNHSGETLRLALAKLLMKENQTEAALSPLAYLPATASVEYLSLRAALAQKSKHNDIALESYQHLTQIDANNSRWWLGLAIQQERAFRLPEAKQSYQQALTKVGLSAQSQAFIRDRLSVLASLEDTKSAN